MGQAPAYSMKDLVGQFAPADADAWRQLAEKALRGQPVDSLWHETADGLRMAPLYPAADITPQPRGRKPGAPWAIVQRVDDSDPQRAVDLARSDLAAGADLLALCFAGGASSGAFGTTEAEAPLEDVIGLLAPTAGGLRLEPHPGSLRTAGRIAEAAEEAQKGRIRFGIDPLGMMAAGAPAADNVTEPMAALPRLVRHLRSTGFTGPVLEADGRAYHDAGATDAQELGIVLATAIAYLRQLTGAGLDAGMVAGAVGFTLAASCDQFATMGKFRALRRLWARCLEMLDSPPLFAAIHGETSRRMATRADAHNNLVRNTVAAFAAGCGGANSIAILPHTTAHGLAEADARRMACNIHHLLVEESHAARVADPGQGSGLVAAITEGLAAQAWSAMQEIEREGGLPESLAAGRVQARIAQSAEDLHQKLADGGHVIVGVTDFVPEAPQAYPVAMPTPDASESAGTGGLRLEPFRAEQSPTPETAP